MREGRNVGGSSRSVTDDGDLSTGSHFAGDLEKNHYNVLREVRKVGGSSRSSRSVTDGDDLSTGSYFARHLEKIHYIVMREGRNVDGSIGSS